MGYTLAVLGCGTMGIAVLSGVLQALNLKNASQSSCSSCTPTATKPNGSAQSSGTSTPTSSFHMDAADASLPSRFIATCGREETMRKLRRTFKEIGGLGSEVEIMFGEEGNLKAVEQADVILICVKPQMVSTLLSQPGFSTAIEGKTVISICAGVTSTQLKGYLPGNCTVVRAMPNTPARIQQGMTIITPIPSTHPSSSLTRHILLGIFTSCGLVRFIDEKHFDVCTALAGSGPAFVALMLEAMADGAVMMGLPREDALLLAAQTMQGTGRMALQTGLHPAQLKDSVTTPGGCTIAGLLTLEDGKVRSTVARTIQVATNHASGLGQEKKK